MRREADKNKLNKMSVEVGLSSNVKFLKVEKAKEFESYRNLPKYSHVPLAVIHPSPRKKRVPTRSPTPNLSMSGTQTKLAVKRYEPKQFPDHLLRAPLDTSSVSSPKRPHSSMPGKGGSGKKSL
jgi:hypothetical protein